MTTILSKSQTQSFYEMAINFENSKDLDEMRQMTREAREIILQKVRRHLPNPFLCKVKDYSFK